MGIRKYAWEVPEILDAMEGDEEIHFDRVWPIRLCPCGSSGCVALIGDAAAS